MIGLISSVGASLVTYPIDSVKTNFQLRQNLKVPEILKTLRNNRGFYSGISSNLTTYPIFWGVFFQSRSYRPAYDAYFGTGRPTLDNVIYTGACGALAGAITNPLFVLKVCSQSLALNNEKPTVYTLARQIYETRGLIGFMRGYQATLYSNTKLAVQFPLYDKMRELGYGVLPASAVSKAISNSLYYPLDIVRTIQRNSNRYISLSQSISYLWVNHGVYGFYRGILVYNSASVPNFILIALFSEWLKND